LVQRFRADDCLVFVIKPFKKLFHLDGLRQESFDFKSCLKYDEEMKRMMRNLHIPYINIAKEDLQDRINIVLGEILKQWPDLQ